MSQPVPVAAPAAPLASGDPTRRFGVDAGGQVIFPGLTRPEAAAASAWLAGMDADARGMALVPVELGVVLSDGAGPHLLDATGALVLVLGPHARIAGASVAMGSPTPLHAVGVVTPDGPGWRWIARASVPDGARVAALDALDACADEVEARRWGAQW